METCFSMFFTSLALIADPTLLLHCWSVIYKPHCMIIHCHISPCISLNIHYVKKKPPKKLALTKATIVFKWSGTQDISLFCWLPSRIWQSVFWYHRSRQCNLYFTSWASSLFWQRPITINVGWFAGCTCKITIRGIPNRLNYCVIFTVYS